MFCSFCLAGRGDEEVDGLLDVFRSEQVSGNPISALSRELSDTSVYSLLEEMKRIVEKVRKEPWRMVESCTDLCQHSVGALT